MRVSLRSFVLVLSVGMLCGAGMRDVLAADKVAAPKTRALIFGVLPYLNTRTLIATYQPVATFLERELKRPVRLLTAPNLEEFARRTFAGEFDFALSPPHYARIAELDNGYYHLLSFSEYNEALLVTGSKEPLRSLDDLHGKTVSIIERSSVLGILAARWFADRGLAEGKDYQFVEAGNHSNAVHQAISGKARVAVIWRAVLKKSPPELQRDAATFGDVMYSAPSYSVIANKRLPANERQAIKDALLRFEQSDEGRAFFVGVGHGGFRDPRKEDTKLLDRMLPETRRMLGGAR